MSKAILFFCFFAVWCTGIHAQQPDSTKILQDSLPLPAKPDSSQVHQKKFKLSATGDSTVSVIDTSLTAEKRPGWVKRFFFQKYPNPKVAALLGIIPGLGQAYNRKWWKIPIVYAGIGGIAYAAITTDKTYQALKTNYKWKVDLNPDTNPVDAPYIYMSATQLKSYRDQFRGYTEKWYLFLGITYLLSITDAFVDAHMAYFDVSDDLTFKLEPAIQSGQGGFGPSFGIGIHVGLGRP